MFIYHLEYSPERKQIMNYYRSRMIHTRDRISFRCYESYCGKIAKTHEIQLRTITKDEVNRLQGVQRTNSARKGGPGHE